MDTIPVGKSGRRTTRLGFGCSSIMGALGRGDSLAMLEVAWDAGIRHFDVAPIYGYGEAEACLGKFLSLHPGQATVTTKYGIPLERPRKLIRMARSIMRPVVKQFPALKRHLASAAAVGAPPQAEKAAFSAAEAQQSLERSLAALRTDHIDVWLLHEVTASELRDEQLLRFLEDSVQAGKIGTFGVGSDRDKIAELVSERPQYCLALQFEWSILNPVPAYPNIFRMHHRSLTENFRSLHANLLADQARCRRWSQSIGADLSDREVLANLMLKAALLQNPESIILFSSKNTNHIQANTALVSSDTLNASAKELYRLVQAEHDVLSIGGTN